MFTKPFSSLSKSDAPIAGGKGASLGEMLNAGIPVPNGYVVLADTFEHFLKETDLVQEIESILNNVDHKVIHTVDDASEKISELILSRPMPENIKEEILSSLDILNAEFVAVRSSATAEDGADHAWAGQLESYLNITKDDLLEKVQHCWSSLFTPRAIFYRFEKGLHTTHISVAVVIQKMVNSEISGIAFSVHPVTEDRNQIIIEAGFGLGEAIVSGSVTPDSYVISKEPRAIIDINVNTQNKALYRDPNGGNIWKDLSSTDANAQVLSKEQILELATIIMRIENHYGFPCDIEWAYEHGEFFIVQSRPITTLSNKKVDKIISLNKLFTREQSLINCQVWSEAEYSHIEKWSGSLIKHHIFKREQYGLFTHWYSDNELNNYYVCLAEHTKENPNHIENLVAEHLLTSNLLRSFEHKTSYQKEDIYSYIELFKKYFETLPAIFDIADCDVSDDIKQKALSAREKTQDLSENTDKHLGEIIVSIFPYIADVWKDISITDLETMNESFTPKTYWGMSGNQLVVGCPSEYLFVEEKQEVLDGVIQGQIACKGIVSGKVKVVKTVKECSKIEEGDILVAIYTSPEYVPYMRLAAAIVSDEGGSISHTAIVARELGKPCVIGTKFGTEILRDGDIVEVDADKGMVTILERALEQKSNSDENYELELSFKEYHTPLFIQLWVNEHYSQAFQELSGTDIGFMHVVENNEFTGYMQSSGSDVLSASMQDRLSVDFFEEQYQRYEAEKQKLFELKQTIDLQAEISREEMVTYLDIIYRSASSLYPLSNVFYTLSNIVEENASAKLIELGITESITQYVQPKYTTYLAAYNRDLYELKSKYFNDTHITESDMYTLYIEGGEFKKSLDLFAQTYAYMTALNLELRTPESFIPEILSVVQPQEKAPISIPEIIKDEVEYLNYMIYFKDDISTFTIVFNKFGFEKLWKACADALSISVANLEQFHIPDIQEFLTTQTKPSDEDIQVRRKKIVYFHLPFLLNEIFYGIAAEDQEQIIKGKYVKNIDLTNVSEIIGKVGSKGIVKGEVKIVTESNEIASFSEGKVLVAAYTAPEFVPAMKKAIAIVTDTGGITSHAAIIARELRIPCVVGTKFATQILKDGDLVEVDADRGVIRIL